MVTTVLITFTYSDNNGMFAWTDGKGSQLPPLPATSRYSNQVARVLATATLVTVIKNGYLMSSHVLLLKDNLHLLINLMRYQRYLSDLHQVKHQLLVDIEQDLVINSRMRQSLFSDDSDPLTFGYSCNFHVVNDDLESIADAVKWSMMVLKRGGAPSLDLTPLRPYGTSVRGHKAVSSGVVPFAHLLDSAMASVTKPNKNSAGLIGLDINHPDLKAFIDAKFTKASKVVYFTGQGAINGENVSYFLSAYNNQSNLFAHKRKSLGLGTNLCTEIEMADKDTCVLGTFNLARYKYEYDFITNFAVDYRNAADSLITSDKLLTDKYKNHKLFKFTVTEDTERNNHVGLSFIGLATLLARFGVSYEELTYPEHFIIDTIRKGVVKTATYIKEVYPEVRRIFTQAPTTNSHQYVTTDDGLAVSAGITPVVGIATTLKDGREVVLQNVVSKDSGNKVLIHPKVETIYDVPQEVVTEVTQIIYDIYCSTGLQQSMSYEYVIQDTPGNTFTKEHFDNWFNSALPSLYYLRKVTPVKQDLQNELKFGNEEIDIDDAELDDIIAACSINRNEIGGTDCDCAG